MNRNTGIQLLRTKQKKKNYFYHTRSPRFLFSLYTQCIIQNMTDNMLADPFCFTDQTSYTCNVRKIVNFRSFNVCGPLTSPGMLTFPKRNDNLNWGWYCVLINSLYFASCILTLANVCKQPVRGRNAPNEELQSYLPAIIKGFPLVQYAAFFFYCSLLWAHASLN